MSPQNILVTLDGTPKLLDFGIAKASLSSHVTRQGVLKGKVGYMAPEQLTGDVTSATDIYSLGIVLWECLANRRLHQGKNDVQMLGQLLSQSIPPLREVLDSSTLPEARWREIVALDPVVMKALNRVPEERFATAAEMLGALSRVATAAHASDVAAWLRRNGADFLTERNRLLASEESSWRDLQELPTDLPDAGSEPSARSGARVAAAAERKPVSPMSPQTARRLLVGGSLLLLLVAMAFLAIVVLVVRRSPSPEGGASLPSVPSAGPPAMVSTIGSFPSAAVSIPAGIVTAGAPSVLSNAKPVPPPMEAPNPSIPSQPTLFWHRPPDGSPSTSATAPPTTLSTAPVATSATAPANCSPPFYFEGRKKVFKPSCL